jgi:valyl-tRNA synthetase
LRQDEDVLDTWFSSWLWPVSVFDGFENPENPDISYYYPTHDLVTGPDIIFFWVARMIMMGYEFRQEKPFRNVYFTGIIRDKLGRKMSKQLGNSPDVLELIAQYGADGVRTGMLFSSTAGNDLMFDEKLCEQGRNFANKIWNAFRLIKGFSVENATENTHNDLAVRWFQARLEEALAEMEDHFSKYRLSDALQKVYNLVWSDFCSWYLEMIKPEPGQSIDNQTHIATIDFLEKLLRILHPFMPFLTEEIWQHLQERQPGESICVAPYPQSQVFDKLLSEQGEQVQELVSQIRNLRSSRGISPKVSLELFVKSSEPGVYRDFSIQIEKLANISALQFTQEKVPGTLSFLIKTDEFFIPVTENIDLEAERAEAEKELAYQKGFLESVMKKLENERFVTNAKPEVVANERTKQADTEARIRALEEKLK